MSQAIVFPKAPGVTSRVQDRSELAATRLIHCTSREVLWLTFKLTLHSLSVGLGSSQFPHPKMSLKRSLWQQCENSSRAQLKKTRLVFGGLGSVEDGREVTEKKLCVKDMLCIRM